MRHTLWDKLPNEDRETYVRFLQIFGALSGLFKETTKGIHANKPYLYYRNHEQLYARTFNVEDLTRQDSAFDAIANIQGERIGIGLKTWIHTRDFTYQKVAEFNKLAPLEIYPIIRDGTPEELIKKVSQLRNDRVNFDRRQYGTTNALYHYITRDDEVMNIVESDYSLIDIDSLNVINENRGTYTFEDRRKKYKFYTSKSVLLEEFNASPEMIIQKVPITLFKDPFELLNTIELPKTKHSIVQENVIYLPLYSDYSGKVMEKSGFNAWNAAPKSKGSNRHRPDFEAYITIPLWVHHVQPNFFGFNALNKEERNNAEAINLHLPDKRIIKAIVTQDNGKGLQTNPQSILGKWILHDVFDLKARELLTQKHLDHYGVDSLKITKTDDQNYKIQLAEHHAFEKWKLELKDKIDSLVRRDLLRSPKFRAYLFEDENNFN